MHSGGGCEKYMARVTFNEPSIASHSGHVFVQPTRTEGTPIPDTINGLRKAIILSQGQRECQI